MTATRCALLSSQRFLADTLSESGCLLCDEVSNRSPLSVRLGRCTHPRENFLLESEHFLLLSDLSPLVPGHCLLITRAHYPSFGCVPREITRELATFRANCLRLVEASYGRPLQFEHGSTSLAMQSGACVHHAHVHLLPVCVPVERWLSEYGETHHLSGTPASPWPDLPRDQAYLAYANQDGGGLLVTRLDFQPPCQFIRRQVASHLCLPNWNWKVSLTQSTQSRPTAHESGAKR
jgi:diadenosine tetraphosphate (Ap4A) HIT family hydrolase